MQFLKTFDFLNKIIVCSQILITITSNLRTCLPTLKSCFDENLKTHVVYKVTFYEFSSIYVGQTSRHVTTGVSVH